MGRPPGHAGAFVDIDDRMAAALIDLGRHGEALEMRWVVRQTREAGTHEDATPIRLDLWLTEQAQNACACCIRPTRTVNCSTMSSVSPAATSTLLTAFTSSAKGRGASRCSSRAPKRVRHVGGRQRAVHRGVLPKPTPEHTHPGELAGVLSNVVFIRVVSLGPAAQVPFVGKGSRPPSIKKWKYMRDIAEITELARIARVDTLKSLWASQSGHPGSSLSALDVMITLYFGGYLRVRPEEPNWPERDIFLLSQGHAAPGYYACLALRGFLPRRELETLRQFGSRLEGHVKRGITPGVESSAGSLGQGLGFGVGAALSIRRKNEDRRVFVMMSDGEQQEGSTWESVMFAGSHQLRNLTAFVDVNRNQINGPTHEIMPIMDDLPGKYAAFGWDTHEIDGHDIRQIGAALDDSLTSDRPTMIISHTVTGKGVPYMEGDYHWHHGKITNDLFLEAMGALDESVSPSPDESWVPGATPTPSWLA